MEKSLLLLFSFCFFLVGCIEEFIPKETARVSGILVVDGAITDSVSVIILNRSVGIKDTIRDSETVKNASLYVKTDKGDKINGNHIGDGNYEIPTGELFPDTQYRLHISLDGEEYESTFLSPIFTPEIDSIAYEKKAKGMPVSINLYTHDDKDQSSYYRWSFQENWETKAEIMIFINDYNLQTSNNIYYCWGKSNSKNLLLGSTEKLSENKISKQLIVDIPSNHDKLSILYHIAVSQQQVRKEAYEYFNNKKENNERSGSIFGPVLSEMKGNIQCISNPEIPVIGYIEVSTVTTKEMYLPSGLGLCEYRSPIDCAWYIDVFEFKDVPPFCYDCRVKENVSKNKPEWWPTSHL